MSKDIDVTDQAVWSASFGLHEWVLEYIARSMGDAVLEADITEIVNENLPALSLPRQPPELRQRIVHLLANSLVAEAERSLPRSEGRDRTIDRLRELADMARAAETAP